MDIKRLKSSHTTYPYPAVDDTDQDLDRRPEAEKREWEHRLIQSMPTKPRGERSVPLTGTGTDSLERDIGERAFLRVGLEAMTTGDNERLLRTHHR